MNKSYLKWAGGKSRILQSVLDTLPEGIECFAEPFVGSATVALNVTANYKMLNDLNTDLITTHKKVYDDYEAHVNKLDILYKNGREDYYLIRDKFNKKEYEGETPSQFIYLNKHGYNGMCRYNKSGGFNIPVGKSNTIHYPRVEMKDFNNNIGSADFFNEDFVIFMDRCSNTVIYCDPPYVPKSVTGSDINYTGEGFGWDLQVKLLSEVLKAQKRGCHVVVSNHDLPCTRELYKDADEIRVVEAFRSISSSANRGKVSELLAIYKAV
jgi:DNA adenine methylase